MKRKKETKQKQIFSQPFRAKKNDFALWAKYRHYNILCKLQELGWELETQLL
jgi:hypothetical protein